MTDLIKHASIAWNPVKATRRHLYDNTLSPAKIIVTYLAVVIGCNLIAISAQNFFFETLGYSLDFEVPTHPLTSNSFGSKMLSSLGVLIPISLVYFLPSSMLRPHGPKEIFAALLIVAASWAFYGALLVLLYEDKRRNL